MVKFINVTENQYIEFLKWYSSAFGGYHYVPVPIADRTVVYDNQEDMNMICYREFAEIVELPDHIPSIVSPFIDEKNDNKIDDGYITFYHISDSIGKYYTRVTGNKLGWMV